MHAQVFGKDERFAYQTTVEQASIQMDVFHISGAFTHQHDQVTLLAKHRSDVNPLQMTMRVTLLNHLQVLPAWLCLFVRRRATSTPVCWR